MGVVHLATQATLGRHVAVKTLRDGQRATTRPRCASCEKRGSPVRARAPERRARPRRGRRRVGRARHRHEADRGARLVRADARSGRDRAPLRRDRCARVEPADAGERLQRRPLRPQPRDPAPRPQAGERDDRRVRRGLRPRLGNRREPARRPERPPAAASQAKEIAGTPHYMAPEMLLGDPSVYSPRTDVYLLGAIFYEIFAGKPPHDGADLQAMLTRHPALDAALRSELPAWRRGASARGRSRASQRTATRAPRRSAWRSTSTCATAVLASSRTTPSRASVLLQKTLDQDPPGEERMLADRQPAR